MAARSSERMTRQRQRILEEVSRLPGHPTADDVYQAVREEMPRISLGTVYRNLDVLSRSGRIRRLENESSPCRYDAKVDRHYHARCRVCGVLLDVDGALVTAPELRDDAPNGFLVEDCHIVFEGLCACCRETRDKGGNGG